MGFVAPTGAKVRGIAQEFRLARQRKHVRADVFAAKHGEVVLRLSRSRGRASRVLNGERRLKVSNRLLQVLRAIAADAVS